jgi:DNA recombination protein RmuC
MEYMGYIAIFVVGAVLGAVVVFLINRFHRKDMEKSFSALSFDALRKNSDEFLKLAYETLAKQTQTGVGELEGKKKLIDQTLEAIKGDLQKVEKLVTEFDGERKKAFGEVSKQLEFTAQQTGKLQETTGKLQAALGNTKVRGQWGERMAEDILQLVGFVENVNYTKQKTQEIAKTRPDYTFLLPQNLKVNMDVKFPLDNYLNYLNAEAETDRESYKQKFIADTRQKIKEVKTRDYINPEENTVDYALMFIPNEQVFCFVHENCGSIVDDALKDKVILCSPVTLFAVLCVMRQAVQIFTLESTAADILSLLDAFNKQWDLFKTSMDKMGKKIEEAQKEYNSLITTRSSQLERPLRKIEDLKLQKGIEVSLPAGNAELASLESAEDKEKLPASNDPPANRLI